MSILNHIHTYHEQITTWRQHIHQHPELGLQEHQTSKYIQSLLDDMGIEYHTGYAGTGIIGVIKNGASKRSIGLRADIDALPITEENDLPYASKNKGIMHACGHDGHTAMLLGAAKYLIANKPFNGTVYLYFQPAEEGLGGARIMLEDGAFEQFKPDEMYGMHNKPGLAVGKIAYKTGVLYANSDRFFIDITGQGGHASEPHLCTDPLIVATYLVQTLQTIVSRNTDPFQPAVISTCVLNAGTTENIIPQYAKLSGTIRSVDESIRQTITQRMQDICDGMAQTFGVKINYDYRRGYPMCVNHAQSTAYVRQVAEDVVGKQNTHEASMCMGGEDFAYFLEKTEGSYFLIGNGNSSNVHTSTYNFNDAILPLGATMFSRLVETRLHHKTIAK